MNILLIENNEAQQHWLEHQLTVMGHEVTTCRQADAVLRACYQTFYPFVLLDVVALKQEGIELCRQLRSLPLRNHQMIVALTDQPPARDLLDEWGADEYLAAPWQADRLHYLVSTLERHWLRYTESQVTSAYLTSVLRVLREVKQLINNEKTPHLILQQICETLTATQGVISVQIKLINEAGILVKIAESTTRQNGGVSLTPGNQLSTWLEYAGKCYGVMNVVFSSFLSSHEEEQSFLNEVAVDVASAVYGTEIELKRRRTEKALRDSKTRYRELGDSITDMFFALDAKLRCTYWNKAAENLTGIAAKDAIGRRIKEIFPGLPDTEAEHGYLEAVRTSQPRSFIHTYQLKGKPVHVEINIYPSRDEFSVFAKDITYRKQMEDALKKGWDYLESLNNSLGDVIFTIKMPEQVIEYVNQAVEHILGYTIDECIGKNTSMFFGDPARSADFSKRLDEAIAQQSEILRTEYVLTRKHGEQFTSEITTTFFRENEQLTRIISIVRDITDRKQMELALEQERASLARKVEERTAELRRMNTELARASQLKDEFLAKMSHDLRTPLNAILGYAKLLKKANALSRLQADGLDVIQNSGEHLLHLINDILDLSKIEAGRLELRPSSFRLAEFLQQIAKMIQVRAEHKDIIFRYEPDPSLPIGISADEKRLREVLSNLLDNAVKFTEHGHVTFRVKQQRSAYNPLLNAKEKRQTDSPYPHTRLRFEVEDSGIGIDPEQQELIFLPFQQGTQPSSIEGTGLGLTISQQLVKMMGGELLVTSRVGQGSRFWFDVDLPEIPEACLEPRIQLPEIIAYKGKQRRVLIVDDKPENRAVLSETLLPLGFEIFDAANGEECLQMAQKIRPDVIFLDLLMPVMDGFESARRLRAMPDLQSVIIIAISASVFQETKKKSLAAGCDDFLPKPIATEDLFACLQRHVGLEWTYAHEPEQDIQAGSSLSREAICAVNLPPDDAALLRKWAACGNVTRLLEELDRLAQGELANHPFITESKKAIQNFQIQTVLEYLDLMEQQHAN